MYDSHSRVPPSKYCKNICEKPIIGTHIVPFIILYSVNRRLLVVDFVVFGGGGVGFYEIISYLCLVYPKRK